MTPFFQGYISAIENVPTLGMVDPLDAVSYTAYRDEKINQDFILKLDFTKETVEPLLVPGLPAGFFQSYLYQTDGKAHVFYI